MRVFIVVAALVSLPGCIVSQAPDYASYEECNALPLPDERRACKELAPNKPVQNTRNEERAYLEQSARLSAYGICDERKSITECTSVTKSDSGQFPPGVEVIPTPASN